MFKKEISKNITRIYENNDSMLIRYRILHDGDAKPIETEDSSAVFQAGKRQLHVNYRKIGEGFEIKVPIGKQERFFGGGDSTRESIMHRGKTLVMDVCNVISYTPIPFLMSTDGWAILVNCTYSHAFDIGDTDPENLIIRVPRGSVDFYIFTGENMKELLKTYAEVAGKPVMMPKFAYGCVYIENEQMDARDLLWNCRTFRELDIPCDSIQLEPNWMSKHYDTSTDKTWDKEKFYLPHWNPDNQSGTFTFFYNMRRMGMQMGLWLCENYDLLYEEEKNKMPEEDRLSKNLDLICQDATIVDAHMMTAVRIDQETKIDEPWFEHLKKFVDNGASHFMLDGATQTVYHPDRLWGGKFHDDEVHNVYPVILAKQMQEGFRDYTGRRLFTYSANGYAGIQQYVATWAGDTGGGPKTVYSVLNHAMCGHTNTSCDMNVDELEGLHYGYLLTYAQQNGWANWRYPWFLGKELENGIRTYAKLRSSLFPYIYSAALYAAETAMPVVRPLQLVYGDETDAYDNVDNMYMLGDSLLVGIYNMHFTLPDGVWVDYVTGKEYSGTVDYEIPEGRGGALFAKKGSVLVTMVPQQYLLEKDPDYEIRVFPGSDCAFTLREDDGWTFDYLEGKIATTEISVQNTTAEGYTLFLGKREGAFEGRPDNGHNIMNNSIPEISGIKPVRDMQVKLFGEAPVTVTFEGKEIETEKDGMYTTFTVPAKAHEKSDLSYHITYTNK